MIHNHTRIYENVDRYRKTPRPLRGSTRDASLSTQPGWVEKYATGCGKLSMPSKHPNTLNKTQINLNKNERNCKFSTIIRTENL